MSNSYRIADLCLEHYKTLPRRGKPEIKREWTLLAGIVEEENGKLTVVSLATGSKCIGKSKRDQKGETLNDSHAETLARRAFLRYLYHQLRLAYSNQESIFTLDQHLHLCTLKEGIRFHFFTSNTPCGDASIIPMAASLSSAVQAGPVEPPHDSSKSLHSSEKRGRTEEQAHTKRVRLQSPELSEWKSCQCSRVGARDASSHFGSGLPVGRKDRNGGDEPMSMVHTGGNSSPDCLRSPPKDFDLPCSSDRGTASSELHNFDGTSSGSFDTKLAEERSSVVPFESGRAELSVDSHRPCPSNGTVGCPRRGGNQSVTEGDNHPNTTRCFSCCHHSSQNGALHHREEFSAVRKHIHSRGPDRVSVKEDIHRTGAKCAPGESQDPRQGGAGYHVTGALRTKPGRGDPSLSMSCSDKMMRWVALGCQGALLSHFLEEPIRLSSVTVARCPYSQFSMERALIHRLQRVDYTRFPQSYQPAHPSIANLIELGFADSKEEVTARHDGKNGRMTPSGSAIIWCLVPSDGLEVSANGKKLGVTAKNWNKPQSQCKISSASLFKDFKELLSSVPATKRPSTLQNGNLTTYSDFKGAAASYQEARRGFMEAFPNWVQTDLDFTI